MHSEFFCHKKVLDFLNYMTFLSMFVNFPCVLVTLKTDAIGKHRELQPQKDFSKLF